MSQFPIDVDAEAIYLDGNWYTRDDLARRIKAMIDQGDFAVARPSAAIEELTAVLHSVRTINFRVTPDFADALNQYATRTGKSVGQLLREAVAQLLTQNPQAPVPLQQGPEPVPVMMQAQAQLQQDDLDQQPRRDVTVKAYVPSAPVPQSSPSQVIAGPGALRAAGVTASPEEKAASERPASEQGWFKQ